MSFLFSIASLRLSDEMEREFDNQIKTRYHIINMPQQWNIEKYKYSCTCIYICNMTFT